MLFDIMIICFSRLHRFSLVFCQCRRNMKFNEQKFHVGPFCLAFAFPSTRCLMNDAAVSRAFSKKSFIPLFRAKLTLTAEMFASSFSFTLIKKRERRWDNQLYYNYMRIVQHDFRLKSIYKCGLGALVSSLKTRAGYFDAQVSDAQVMTVR